MAYSRAYSSSHGYDLRTPYNIQMGEIKRLTVVRPFSIRSYQKNTIVEGFTPRLNDKEMKREREREKATYTGFPQGTCSPARYIQVLGDPVCNRFCYSVVEAREPCSYRDVQLGKLYMKDTPRLK